MVKKKTNNKALTDDDLTKMLRDCAEGGSISADEFFSGFNYLQELLQGNYSRALDEGINLLLKCLALDEAAFKKIPKGTPFYWLGTAAFLVNDFETAVYFYDAAVSEDLRQGVDPKVDETPALLFVQIQGKKQNQAARELVGVLQARVEEMLDEYNDKSGRPENIPELKLDDIRQNFLKPSVSPDHRAWRTLATAFISFILEWDYRNKIFDLIIKPGTVEPFLVHLFKGCLLFESLLKANPKFPLPDKAKMLGSVLQHLRKELGISHNIKIGEANFKTILDELRCCDNSIQTAILITGRVRNSIGHNLGWEIELDKIKYQKLFRLVAFSCFHAIACLYR